MMLRSRVPGKAVLLGEYAVTDGLPAIAMAVDRAAELTLCPCAAEASQLEARQVLQEAVAFRVGDRGGLAWDRDCEGWDKIAWTAALIDRIIDFLDPAEIPPFRLSIDTSELYIDRSGRRVKLGLGSSSAITVGLYQVLRAQLRGPEVLAGDELLAEVLPIYRAAQQGYGSGIDLATSIHGGLIEFSNDHGGVATRSHPWPSGLLIDFAWTGRASSTPKLLARYRQWQSERPEQAADWHALAGRIMAEAQQALQDDEADSLVRLIGAYGRGMSTIGSLMNIDLTPATHMAIMQQAERLGLSAKPSGAGVGDLALIAGTSEDSMNAMRAWMASNQIARVAMQPFDQGALAAP